VTHESLDPSGPWPVRARIRAAANGINGSTLLGLGVGVLGRCRIRRGPRGLWLADRYRYRFPVAGAFTVGDVLITADDWPRRALAYPDLLAHEERHAVQYAWCGGLPFIPLYVLAMGWSMIRTGNVFERRAGLAAGGYSEAPTRTWSSA
jgi:hypothetical protein